MSGGHQEIETSQVFIGGLSVHVTEAELHEYLNRFAPVSFCEIVKDSKGHSKGYGFAEFSASEDARKAVGKSHVLQHKVFEVRLYVDPSQNLAILKQIAKRKVFLSGLKSLTEKEITEYFSKFGAVENVTLNRHHETQNLRGFGFIMFVKARDAQTVLQVTASNPHIVAGVPIKVAEAMIKQEMHKKKVEDKPANTKSSKKCKTKADKRSKKVNSGKALKLSEQAKTNDQEDVSEELEQLESFNGHFPGPKSENYGSDGNKATNISKFDACSKQIGKPPRSQKMITRQTVAEDPTAIKSDKRVKEGIDLQHHAENTSQILLAHRSHDQPWESRASRPSHKPLVSDPASTSCFPAQDRSKNVAEIDQSGSKARPSNMWFQPDARSPCGPSRRQTAICEIGTSRQVRPDTRASLTPKVPQPIYLSAAAVTPMIVKQQMAVEANLRLNLPYQLVAQQTSRSVCWYAACQSELVYSDKVGAPIPSCTVTRKLHRTAY